MTDYYDPLPFSEEQFAAWLDGTMSPDEEQLFMQECASNPDMQSLLDANDNIDDSFEEMIANGYEMPEELYADSFQLPEIGDFDDVDDHVFGFDDQIADDDDVANSDDITDDDDISDADDIANSDDISDADDIANSDDISDDDDVANSDDINSGFDQFFI
ncbi:hypothetical protein [Prevotella merdae]|uniref:hypothetical protein n=1 Tax=Prevotella merdae TaxID=2079531 RepID=UPI003F7DDE8D